jgi:hypothetical protein
MNLASEGVAELAALIASSVPALADQIEKHPDLTELTHRDTDVRARATDPSRVPSKSALSTRKSG